VVVVLMLIYVNSFLDRSILSLLVDPIRSTLHISESQMGFLMGPAFAIFYIIAGLPLGRLADVMPRRWLVFGGQFVWSIMSVACAFIGQYWQFLSLRVGLGVGEASLSPAAYSMITDLFPRNKLSRALSVYGFGIFLGAGFARLLGGLVIGFTEGQETVMIPLLMREIFSWQIVFLFVALPTIPLSILLLTIKEPLRHGTKSEVEAGAQVGWGETMAYIARNKTTMICHGMGFALLSFSGYGAGSWNPSHFHRNFGLALSEIGIITGLINAIGGTIGILFGGWLADHLQSRGVRNNKTMVGLIAAVAWAPFGIAYPLMTNSTAAFACLAGATSIAAMPWGVGPAGIQEIMPNRMRGQASAVYLFIINFFGIGLGPFIPSLLTQYVFKSDEGVRYSLLVVPGVAHFIAAILLFVGLKPFLKSLDRVDEWRKAHGAATP
jgi:MFS family permease